MMITEVEDTKVMVDQPSQDVSSSSNDPRASKRRALLLMLAFGVVLAIILIVVLTGKEESPATLPPTPEPPMEFDFRTGVSLITYYGVEATISQRLAQTTITMQIDNGMNCTSIHGVTFQLPFSARVASLSTVADNGCKTHGDIQPLQKARDTFADTAKEGIPGAYVEARDSDTYSLQVSLPPFGSSVVEVVVEELLRQRVGKVEFHIPFVPNEEVDNVALDITILDVDATTKLLAPNITFDVDIGPDFESTGLLSPYSKDIPNARYHDLPPILQGSFTPTVLPENGVLLRDGNCFEHIFLPPTLDPISKNVIFLWDTTFRNDRTKAFFQESKKALKSLINQLTLSDQLTIQTFGNRGTLEVYEESAMSNATKLSASQFVDSIRPEDARSNLHEALLEALLRAGRKESTVESSLEGEGDDGPNTKNSVTLLVLLSNSRPRVGATNRTNIARDVWELNQRSQAKIFSLASPDADVDLLRAIAIMNDGIATAIPEATAGKMVNYFQSEMGIILLSDINFQYKFVSDGTTTTTTTTTTTQLHGLTRQYFPVATMGTEVVVRGRLIPADNQDTQDALLQAVTSAVTDDGPTSWSTTAWNDPFVSSPSNTPSGVVRNTRCFQSYAHARITQLMKLRDVAKELGDYVVEPVVVLTKPCNRTNTTLAKCIEREALDLAIESKLVARGLTGMVTIDEAQCFVIKNGSEICLDGTSKEDFWSDGDAEEAWDPDVSESATIIHGFDIIFIVAMAMSSLIHILWWTV